MVSSGEPRRIGVALLGYAFMGKAHSHAYKAVPHFFHPPPAIPELVVIYGRHEDRVREAARNYGFKRYTTDWRAAVRDPEVEIVDNSLPNNMHLEPTLEALEAGKHVLCEKPLARNAEEARVLRDAARRAKVKTMVAFNYRFVPAVQLARQLVKSGVLGRIYHFRARYLQDWLVNPSAPLTWRLRAEEAGSGPLGDLGSHIIDLARFLVGEITAVTGVARTFIEERPLAEDPSKRGRVTVEDAFSATAEFENGAIGTLEASRFATGRKNYNNFEINGEHGSIEFNLERLNELRVYLREWEEKGLTGWSTVLVTERRHPYIDRYWPPGHIIGWEHTFINEVYHFLNCIVKDEDVAPIGATFEDGYRCNVIMDAVLESAKTGKRITVSYS
ncbi:MAG: Gfo/Idh/MocA family oxidoreductase [Thermofilaceae archaeon]